MKKQIAAIVIFAMLLCLCACDGGRKKPASTGSDLTWEEIEKLIEESE